LKNTKQKCSEGAQQQYISELPSYSVNKQIIGHGKLSDTFMLATERKTYRKPAIAQSLRKGQYCVTTIPKPSDPPDERLSVSTDL
jgi:hypothetical protein